MSISIIAPQKFKFQDAVCIEMMLRFEDLGDARFIVEPPNGEDAELYSIHNASGPHLEIQIKGSSGRVTLAKVATCLAHTPPRTEENTLFERLLSDPKRLVVFVMSGRCDDECAGYAVGTNWNGTPHSTDRFNRASARMLLDAFAQACIPVRKQSHLWAGRRAHNFAVAKCADIDEVTQAMSRLIILEQVDAASVQSFCTEYLRNRYRIPTDRSGDIFRRLLADVERVKVERTDAYPLVRDSLADASPRCLRPSGYIMREDESALVEELSKSGVLLLSGKPRVGKTYTSRWIAAEFQSLGYEVQESNEIDQVERFLLEPTADSRLCVLDDPLGGSHAARDRSRTLSRINTLIPKLPSCCKLIVAQVEPILLETARVKSVGAVSTGNCGWYDLGTLSALFLAQLWQSLASTHGTAKALEKFVSVALTEGSLSLEPGSLEYLAVNHKRLNDPQDMGEITELAREDAIDLGRALADAGHEQVLVALALGTFRQEAIDHASLAFVMGAGGDALPGRSASPGVGVVLGGQPDSEPAKPGYDSTPALGSDQSKSLESLERLRVVEVGPDGFVRFSHPYYRAAAENLIDGVTHNSAMRISSSVQRGLFCLSPVVASTTAKNLNLVFDGLAQRSSAQTEVVNHAIDGLKSCFLATRDVCFSFLVERYSELPIERPSDLPEWTSAVAYTDLDNLQWADGHAHFPIDGWLDAGQLPHVFARVKRTEVETEVQRLNGAENRYVSPERAARALKYFANEVSELQALAIGRLLSYDEAVLRAEATKLWLSTSRKDDGEVLSRIFSEVHPRCAVAALRGAISGWRDYSPERQHRVLDGLSNLASYDTCATVMLDRLVVFNRVEHTGEGPPWRIFEVLVPIIMNGLPASAVVNDARMYHAVDVATTVLPDASVIAICDGWIGWLERNAQDARLPSAFSLGVVKILVASTRQTPELRSGRIERMLAFGGTGFLIRFVADLVDEWEALTASERSVVLDRLMSGRSDDHWLQAVALTRDITPKTVEKSLLGNDVSLNDGANTLCANIDPTLLKAAVHVHVGCPQPLSWLGVNYSGQAVWGAVVELVARMPTDPLFELAWDHIANSMDGARLSRIITDVGRENAEQMLDILLRIKLEHTGNFMPEAWAVLLGMAPDEGTWTMWIDKMASFISAILDDVSDLEIWLTEQRDFRGMLPRLRGDLALLRTARELVDSAGRVMVVEIQPSEVSKLEALLEKEPPHFYRTCDRVSGLLKKNGIVALNLTRLLDDRREVIFKQRRRLKDEIQRPAFHLNGWVEP